MKIVFENKTQPNTETLKAGQRSYEKQVKETNSISVSFDGKNRVGLMGLMDKKKSKQMEQLQEQAGNVDVQNMRNQLTVMSHTMSDEDFAKMQEEGFDVTEVSPEEAVTILDKIKAELIKAGENIAGFTDTIDVQTLGEAVGSVTLAQNLVQTFAQADIPITKDNLEKTLQAVNIGTTLKEPTDSTVYYMVSNHLDASVKGFYIASASGSKVEQEKGTQYYGEEIKGYYSKSTVMQDGQAEGESIPDTEIAKLLSNLELEGTKQEQEAARWLIDKGLPVDEETLPLYLSISEVEFPLEEKKIIEAAAHAILWGKDPMDGLLAVQERRILEEIRWSMTAKANLQLAESDFSIDTNSMEKMVEELRKIEEEMAGRLFPKDENAVDKYHTYLTSTEVFKEIPTLPVDVLGNWTSRWKTDSVHTFYSEAKALLADFAEAGRKYEAVWTSPRADLGDSMKKAFANVNDILEDLKYESTSENQKAVRILGYNRMEITVENVDLVKEAVKAVERVVERMTPAATLKMIRDGVNPLEKSFGELQEYFEALPSDYASDSRHYSSFLQALEHNGEISEQEREAFIGCYRLLRQIEKSDGAAIGNIVNVGVELNFATLLSAVRTQKFKYMDVTVSDSLGAVTERVEKGISISEQINAGFTKELQQIVDAVAKDGKGLKADAGAARELMQEAVKASEESSGLLARAEIPVSVENVVAAQNLLQEHLQLWDRQMKQNKDATSLLSLWESLGDGETFANQYVQELEQEMDFAETQTFEQAKSTIEVRDLQLFHKQLHIMKSLVPNEEFFLPLEIGGELTGVHLQIQNGEGAKGKVRISLESIILGKIGGEFQVGEKGVKGYFVGNQKETVMNLSKSADIFYKSFESRWNVEKIDFVHSEKDSIPMDWTTQKMQNNISNEGLYDLAKYFLEYVKNLEPGK